MNDEDDPNGSNTGFWIAMILFAVAFGAFIIWLYNETGILIGPE